MKSLSFAPLLLLIGFMSLTACHTSGPENTVSIAYQAIMDGDLSLLNEVLSPSMQSQFGNKEEMERMKAKLSTFQEFEVVAKERITPDQKEIKMCSPAGFHSFQMADVQRFHEVQIQGIELDGKLQPLLKVNVNCTVFYREGSKKGGKCFERDGQICKIVSFKE